MTSTSIKNIIFDLGNVIININHKLTVQALARVLSCKVAEIEAKVFKISLFQNYEKGFITDAVFRKEVRNTFDLNISDDDLDAIWNALLLDIPKKRINLLRKIAKNYRLFLLSNTNEIHLQGVEKILERDTGFESLDIFFERTYYSHRMGKRKPEAEIYLQVLEENQLKAEETVFFDDDSNNIEAARQLGINAVHIDPRATSIVDFFENNFLNPI